MAYYASLLKLCGFDDEEMEKERSRIEEVFGKLELKPEDMGIAVDWVRQNHDIELIGVRKLLRAWLLELFALEIAGSSEVKFTPAYLPFTEPDLNAGTIWAGA